MEKGFALKQTFVPGTPDFVGSNEILSFSPGGPGKMVEVWKCIVCGRSITA